MDKGFTLVELLLYIAIIAIVLLASATLLLLLMQSRTKNAVIAEVEQQGTLVMARMTQVIRNADNITAPTIGNSDSSLTLDVIDGAKDPTIFDLSSGAIRIKEGAGSAIALTNSRVSASGLTFQNLSQSSTPGNIRIQFTITYINNSGGRNEYAFTKSFYGSASLR